MLRVIATLAVITMHVCSKYNNIISDTQVLQREYVGAIEIIDTYSILSRFAVPIFVMLSGAFILQDERNRNYQYFYKKSLKKIGVPTLIFSILYICCQYTILGANILIKGERFEEIHAPLINLIKGTPYYHMWYLYMIMGVYMLVPVLINFKNSITSKMFSKISWIFLVVASFSMWTSTHDLKWDIGMSFCYLGYFMVGYDIRKQNENIWSKEKGVCLLIFAVILEFITLYTTKCDVFISISEKYSMIEPYSPLIVCASLLIFIAFSMIEIKKDLSKIAKYTFEIYLVHALVWQLISKGYAKLLDINISISLLIIVSVVSVLIISWILGVIYTVLWKKIENKYDVSNKLAKIIGL